MEANIPAQNPPKFFGRRKGRIIHKAKSVLLEKFLPQLKITESTDLTPNKLFNFAVEKMYLEIGFGNGEHLAGQAQSHPEIGFIGAEVFQNGIANLLSLITGIKEGSQISENIELKNTLNDNIRIFDDDIRLLFKRIPDKYFDRVFLLFPDPWPKKRHAARRFINPENLQELARIIKPQGLLRIATDHPVYKSWVLHQMHNSPDFYWTATCGKDWKTPPADWIETKYQRKALREGRRPVFFDYARK